MPADATIILSVMSKNSLIWKHAIYLWLSSIAVRARSELIVGIIPDLTEEECKCSRLARRFSRDLEKCSREIATRMQKTQLHYRLHDLRSCARFSSALSGRTPHPA